MHMMPFVLLWPRSYDFPFRARNMQRRLFGRVVPTHEMIINITFTACTAGLTYRKVISHLTCVYNMRSRFGWSRNYACYANTKNLTFCTSEGCRPMHRWKALDVLYSNSKFQAIPPNSDQMRHGQRPPPSWATIDICLAQLVSGN